MKLPIIVNDFAPQSVYEIYTPTYDNLPVLVTGGGCFHAQEKYYVERNTLNMYLILFTMQGCGDIVYRDKKFELLPGQAILINGMEYHKYQTSAKAGRWDFEWIRFYSPHISLYDDLINQGRVNLLSVRRTNFEELFDLALQQLKCENVMKCILLSDYVSSMLTTMCSLSSQNNSSENPRWSEDIELSRRYILEHYKHQISIKELANISCMNPQAFIRKFKKQLGIAPYTLIQKTRMSKAAALLESSKLSISDISEQVGYNQLNNFCKQFKNEFKYTPSQYRRLFQITD